MMSLFCAPNCGYTVPTDYNPSINHKNYNPLVAKTVHSNCTMLFYNDLGTYTCCAVPGDRLKGYGKGNPLIKPTLVVGDDKTQSREAEREIVRTIMLTFEYILNINTERPLRVDQSDCADLRNTYLYNSFGRAIYYTGIAKKVIQQYSKEQYPELYEVAHRVLHERRCMIPIKVKTIIKTPCTEFFLEEEKDRKISLRRRWVMDCQEREVDAVIFNIKENMDRKEAGFCKKTTVWTIP